MLKSNVLILHPEYIDKMAKELYNKNPSLEILFYLLVETGREASQLSKMLVGDMKCYIDTNTEISEKLRKKMTLHMTGLKNTEYCLVGVRAKDRYSPLSKRTYESTFLEIGKKVGIEKLGVKDISKVYYYNLLRSGNYDYARFVTAMKKRGRYISSLSDFLDSCCISIEEYSNDVQRNLNPSVQELCDSLENIITEATRRKDILESGQCTYNELIETKDFCRQWL